MTALFWASAVADAAVILAVLLRRWPAVAATGAVAAALKVAALAVVGTGFGLMHLLYLDVVVALPLVGLGLLVLGNGRRRLSVGVVAVALLALAPVGVYATFVEPERLQVERVDVPLAPEREGSEPVRIAVVADIQTDDVSDYDRRAVRRARELRPDVVLIPGDLFQMPDRRVWRQRHRLRALVRELRAPGGVFVVPGDTDHVHRLRWVLPGTGARLLVNDIARTRVRGRTITIGGLERHWDTEAAMETAEALEARRGADDVRILLAHRPDAAVTLGRNSRVDLVVAGHTHGGQVQLPLIGPPVTKTGVPRRVAAGGLHTVDGRRIYVSRGIGVEHAPYAPRVRFLCPPELTLLTLAG